MASPNYSGYLLGATGSVAVKIPRYVTVNGRKEERKKERKEREERTP